MRTLVTGGAGFIGSNLVALLREEGHDVRVLDDLSSGWRKNVPDGVHLVEADVCDADAVNEAARGVETIFHLAASVGNARSIEHPIHDARVNVLGTLNVLEAARRGGARRVVYSSSAGIFGELRTLPIREDHPAEPDTPYGASKLAAEKQCLAYAKLYPLDAICLRYFNVYGLNQRYDAYGNVIPIFARHILEGTPLTIFSDGEQTRDFVNVRDVARANLQAALTDGVSGAFNLGSGTRITINRLVEVMQEVSGIRAQVRYGSARAGDVRDSLADVRAAREKLGYEPGVRMEEGLAEYMAWARGAMGPAAAAR